MDLSILKLTSDMARHASAGSMAVSRNISHSDLPGATRVVVPEFSKMMESRTRSGAITYQQTDESISLEAEMVDLATHAGRHTAAVTIWSKTLDLVRIAAGTPR